MTFIKIQEIDRFKCACWHYVLKTRFGNWAGYGFRSVGRDVKTGRGEEKIPAETDLIIGAVIAFLICGVQRVRVDRAKKAAIIGCYRPLRALEHD